MQYLCFIKCLFFTVRFPVFLRKTYGVCPQASISTMRRLQVLYSIIISAETFSLYNARRSGSLLILNYELPAKLEGYPLLFYLLQFRLSTPLVPQMHLLLSVVTKKISQNHKMILTAPLSGVTSLWRHLRCYYSGEGKEK